MPPPPRPAPAEPPPDARDRRRRELLPVLTGAFAELGYRRTTTAELAQRCGLRENVLYRLWSDKRAMFVAAIQHVYDRSADTWARIAVEEDDPSRVALRLLEHEATHHGEHGLYRILFAGLSETDDAEIRDALREVYGRFQRLLARWIAAHRSEARRTRPAARRAGSTSSPELAAWALVGLGTVTSIGRELALLDERARRRVLAEIGKVLLDAR